MEIKNWLVGWFDKNSTLNSDKISQSIQENYLENGWIDSLKFISLITDIEKYFNIKFSNNDFNDKNFMTISGLLTIITRKKNE